MDKHREQQVDVQQTYTYDDILKLENQNRYSSFGKSNMMLSNQRSAPKWRVGSASRDVQLYQEKEIAKTQFGGKYSPGPIYYIAGTDEFKYSNNQRAVIGKQARKTFEDTHYDYYDRKEADYDPSQADLLRRAKQPAVRIGLQNRFPNNINDRYKPGPQYDPVKQPTKNVPQYSIGVRRGNSATSGTGSTPVIVGPGAYFNGQKIPNTSTLDNAPLYSFTQGPKFGKTYGNWDLNQTYDTKQPAIGSQINSKKRSGSAYTIGKAQRDAKVGHFQGQMAKIPTPVRISHPKF